MRDLTGEWQRVARVRDIDVGIPVALSLDDGRRICLVRDGSEVYAVEDRCPHRDFAISSGDVVAPCVLECPWHGARFDVRDGHQVDGPESDPLRTFAVRVIDDVVFVGSSTRL